MRGPGTTLRARRGDTTVAPPLRHEGSSLLFGLLAIVSGVVAGVIASPAARAPLFLVPAALLGIVVGTITVVQVYRVRTQPNRMLLLPTTGRAGGPRAATAAADTMAPAAAEPRQPLGERMLECGLIVLVFITYTRFSDVLVHDHGAPSIAQPLVALLLLGLIAGWAVGVRREGWLHPALLIAGIGVVRYASLLYAADSVGAQAALEDFTKDAIIAVIVIVLLERGVTLRRVVWALLAAGVLLGTMSVVQYLTGSFGRFYLGFAKAEIMNIIGGHNDYRVGGPMGDPNFYAQILLPLVPLALDRLRQERSWPWRLAAAWALAVCVLAIIFTFSRGAFIALVMMLGLIVVRHRPKPRHLVVALLISAPLVVAMPSQYRARIMTILDVLPGSNADPRSEVSFRGRTSELLAGWMMFTDHPLFGVGFHNYPAHYRSYSRLIGLDPRREDRAPHSLYVEVGAETGLVGLTVFGMLLWGVFGRMHRSRQALAASGLIGLGEIVAALSVGILGYLAAAVFLHAAYPRFFWLLVGIALATPRIVAYERSVRSVALSPAMPRPSTVALARRSLSHREAAHGTR